MLKRLLINHRSFNWKHIQIEFRSEELFIDHWENVVTIDVKNESGDTFEHGECAPSLPLILS